jgi:ATP-dependent DNA helicase RecQ
MTFYSTTADCLRRYILRYFGENPPYRCDNCGNCVDASENAGTEIEDTSTGWIPKYNKDSSWRNNRERKGERPDVRERGARKERKIPAIAQSVDKDLFIALRKLRHEIAKEISMPAYIVFTDSTLTDICMKMPKTKGEFLRISGVGHAKFEKFGERFIQAVKEYQKA